MEWFEQFIIIIIIIMKIASECKIVKYVELSNSSCFCLIVIETFGPVNDLSLFFLDELGRWLHWGCKGNCTSTSSAFWWSSNNSIPFCFVAALLLHHVRDHARTGVQNSTSIICNTFRALLRVNNKNNANDFYFMRLRQVYITVVSTN